FGGSAGLSTITIPTSVTSIGTKAFFNAAALSSVVFKGKAPTVGADAFKGVAADATASRASNLTGYGIDGATFNGLIVDQDGSDFFFADDEAGGLVVSGCAVDPCAAALVVPSVVGGLPVTAIASAAFQNQVSITSLVFTSGGTLASIGDEAFSGATGLKIIVIPSSVLTIGNSTFQETGSLASVTFLGNAPTVGTDAFKGVKDGARAYITLNLTGYPKAGLLYNGLIITTPSNKITPAKVLPKVAKTAITLTTSVKVPGAGKLVQTMTSKAGRRVTTQCTAKVTATSARAYTLTCKVGKAGRAALRKAALTLTSTISFTPTGGTKASKVQVVKLKRVR
ncbi:MAG: leucine-rich repeat domain-containing protein, partial [Solirubrobacterales bacterium]|nr:leucine-rich repeat domain-containing protein [Solirubrobacterales bacterium]